MPTSALGLCDAPKSFISVGRFQGLREGCVCPDNEVRTGMDCGKKDVCEDEETVDEMEPEKAYVWRGYKICAEYFVKGEYTNILASASCPSG